MSEQLREQRKERWLLGWCAPYVSASATNTASLPASTPSSTFSACTGRGGRGIALELLPFFFQLRPEFFFRLRAKTHVTSGANSQKGERTFSFDGMSTNAHSLASFPKQFGQVGFCAQSEEEKGAIGGSRILGHCSFARTFLA